MSQLPFLKFGEGAGISKNSFLEEAEKWLSEKEFLDLKKADFDFLQEGCKNNLLKEYTGFELSLRKEIALYRENSKSKKEFNQSWEVLSKALLEGNPLEVEKKLFFLRWQTIEDLALGFSFSLEAVAAFFVKLQIVEKIGEFDKDKGTVKFDELTEVSDEKIR